MSTAFAAVSTSYLAQMSSLSVAASQAASSRTGHSNAGAIAGGVVGGVVGIAVIASITLLVRRKMSISKQKYNSDSPMSENRIMPPTSPVSNIRYDPNDPRTFPGAVDDRGSSRVVGGYTGAPEL
ncbi:hypothetical protein CONPUDRAFT_149556 [Coniophora puteana RWD-64-598 SS2]|uniref:Uncharacterized protein n=1 Tax=Coniophora puteana (strain RWD-64-598) TaxID=741705 RepID=A0A5M3MZU8_CONPW|nr:uncharacterized protein CONPUDRAFT_149556 [Coniophora puteana RWD-64-598 SS2]EIW84683.1 hypothetical protein CONPUDRAFT_149556 [Coniophora puteana RWD-64-598 SS2]